MKPLNWTRLFYSIVAVFVTIFFTDYLIHGWWMAETYRETAQLWRPEEEMKNYMMWMFMGQFFIGAFLCTIFAKGYEGKGWMEGLRYGLLIGSFGVAHFFVMYAVTPYPFSIFFQWVLFGLVQSVFCGIVCAFVYGWGGAMGGRKAMSHR